MTTDDTQLPSELAAAIDRLDQLVKRFEEHPDPAVKDRVFELLTCVDAVHRLGLRRLNELLKLAGLQRRALDDPEVRLLFDMYDLGEDGEDIRFGAMIETVKPGLAEMGVDIELLETSPTSVRVRLIHPPSAEADGLAELRSSLQLVLLDSLPGVSRVEIELTPLPPPAQNNFVPLTALKVPPRLQWQSVVPLADLLPGTLRSVRYGDMGVLLTHLGGGEVYAYRNCCPGTPFPLDGATVEDGTLRCPWHNCRFDLRGGRRLDAQAPGLGVIPVRVEDGVVRIAVP